MIDEAKVAQQEKQRRREEEAPSVPRRRMLFPVDEKDIPSSKLTV